MNNHRRFLIMLAVSALLAATSVADTGAQPVATAVLLDGTQAPSGSTLFSDSVVATLDQSATVNLVNGQTLVLAPNSTASFEASDSGDVHVAVREGSASYRVADGTVVAAFKNDLLIANQDGVYQGEPIEQEAEPVPVCILTSPSDPTGAQACKAAPKKKGCEWQRDDADPAALEAQGTNFYEVESIFDCKSRKGWIALLGVGALSSGSTAAIVSGAVLGSVVIIDQTQTSSSPTRPGG